MYPCVYIFGPLCIYSEGNYRVHDCVNIYEEQTRAFIHVQRVVSGGRRIHLAGINRISVHPRDTKHPLLLLVFLSPGALGARERHAERETEDGFVEISPTRRRGLDRLDARIEFPVINA